MKVLISLFIIFASSCVFADDTVRITALTDLVVSGFSGATYNLNVDKPSGDATAESAPARVYVPLTNNTPADHDKYFSQYKSGVTALFNSTDVSHVIKFPLTTAVTGTKYLYVAAKLSTGTTYKLIKKYTDSTLSGTQEIAYFNVSPSSICAQYTTDCVSISPTIGTNTSKTTFTLYFFISPTVNIALGDTVVPSTSTGGVFFEVVLSNRIYLDTDLKVFITNPRKGDKRILMDYTSDNSMLDFKKIVVFNHSSAPGVTNKPIGDAGYAGALISHDYSTSQSGSIVVNDLTNGTPVTLSVAFMDKFGFLTTLSDDITEQPTEIQELLKKQACFILTAGFGEEHYVTNFFRSYRDRVLANSWIGRKFIKIYYSSAPHYAVIIYNHPLVRLGIRAFAYTLYFLFNFGWTVLVFILTFYYLNILRKNKILMEK